MSGQLFRAMVCRPFACGSGPSLLLNSMGVFIAAKVANGRGKRKNKIERIWCSPYMVFRVPIWGGQNPKIPKDPGREHANAPPDPEMEPREAGGKGGPAPRLHRQSGARRRERLPGCPHEDRGGLENPVERVDARRVAHVEGMSVVAV
jgi:hypothetical protein